MDLIELFKVWSFSIAPTLATVLISIAYIPQIVKTARTKSVSDLSLWFWILINGFLLCMWSNSLASLIYDGRVGYFVTESVNFGLALVVLIQIIYYRRKNK